MEVWEDSKKLRKHSPVSLCSHSISRSPKLLRVFLAPETVTRSSCNVITKPFRKFNSSLNVHARLNDKKRILSLQKLLQEKHQRNSDKKWHSCFQEKGQNSISENVSSVQE